MFSNFFINPIFWLIAVASCLAWARFATWVAEDVSRLSRQSELLWRLVPSAVLVVMTLVWVSMPSFWVALPVNFVLVAGVVGWYWAVRVGELGSKGHLFSKAIQGMEQASQRMGERRAQRQVSLSYMGSDDRPIPLPKPEDPAATGVSYADQMLAQALEKRADDIELSPGAQGYDLKFVVDGVSFPQPAMARATAEPLIQAIKQLAGLSLEERRRPQEGTFKVRDEGGNLTKWTVRTSGTTAGEKLIMAANEKGRWSLALDQLGFNAEQLAAVRGLAADTQGVVIVATPRMTGRTTTLYALLGMHDAFINSVHTLETNPQAEMEGVTVHRFDPRNAEQSYAKALQSMFLKDPNVALSSQCPDAASAEAIARFAREDHRVYLGLPAFDTMAALEIWLQLVPDKQLAVRSLRAIVSQRLVRLLCPTCKAPYQPDEATLRRLNLPVGRNLQSFKANTEGLRDQKGNRMPCPDCGSIGFRGRTGIFEVLILNDEMRKAILENATADRVKAMARKNNMMLLVEHGIRKFAAGLTTISEVQRVLTPDRGASPSAASGVNPAQK